jgi:ParB-like chromosome segregation protein Spo0J
MDPSYWTQEQIGQVAGRDKGYISRSISLLSLPEPIKEKLRARNFSRSHAVEFLRLPSNELKFEAFRSVEDRKLSWENTRQLVDQMLGKNKKGDISLEKTDGLARDPLASLWPQLLGHRAIEAMGGWVVMYRKGHWNFSVSSTAVPTKEALAAWFIQMASALTVASAKGEDIVREQKPEINK